MKASLLILPLLIATVHSLGIARSGFQCSRYCKENSSRFGYEIGNSYNYIYAGSINTFINTSMNHDNNIQNKIQFTTNVKITGNSACDYVMHLSNVRFATSFLTTNSENYNAFQNALSDFPLHFSYQNGRIENVCVEEENRDVLHVKKAVLSAFQNSMPNFDQDTIVYETDITGSCETYYKIKTNSPLVIQKTKKFEACSHRKSREISWLPTPHSVGTTKKWTSILRSSYNCEQRFNDKFILESTECYERHQFQPFSNGNNGAVTYATQSLKLIGKNNEIFLQKFPNNFHHESLLFDHEIQKEEKTNQIINVLDLLTKLEKRIIYGIQPDVPRLFSQLTHEIKALNQQSLMEVFNSVKSNLKKKKCLLDALALTNSLDGLNVMKILYKKEELTEIPINSWLSSLVFLKNVSLSTMEAVTPLLTLNKSIKQQSVLSVSSLAYIYCRTDDKCIEKVEIQKIFDIIRKPLTSNCLSINDNNYHDILLALKGLGNIGISNSQHYLRSCFLNSNSPIELRLAAITAHRRINCLENENLEHFQDLFSDYKENTEIRIASYLAAMQCASYETFAQIRDVLRKEETNQVGSFVWTHLTNLQESSTRWKQTLKNLIENEFLRNKFSTDMRKYSRNYEFSTYSDSFHAGGTLESNVVFTSESYLPKSAILNLTLDIFGESVNIFELGTRFEGFEQVIENLFGPEGYFPEESIRNILQNMKNAKNETSDRLTELQSLFASQTIYKQPSSHLYAKIFGNEIYYADFEDLQSITTGSINGASILDALIKILREQDVDYVKSFAFIDSSYKIPTLLGFPLELYVNGTGTVGLTIKGKMDLKDLWAHKLVVEGKISPSIALEITGSMIVDCFIIKIGLQSINNLNSNMYLNGHVFFEKGRLVNIKINVPNEKIDMINVESKVILIPENKVYEIDDINKHAEKWQECTPKNFNTITGIKYCYGMHYVNASLVKSAPYFPLTGKFHYFVSLQKTDIFENYHLQVKTSTDMKNEKPIYYMSFYFDTPNSEVNRKVRAAYLINCDELYLNVTLLSPFLNLEISSKIGNDFDNLEFIFQTKLNDNEIIFATMSLESTKVNSSWHYKPLAKLNYQNKQIAALSGAVNYLEGSKYNANLTIEGVAHKPIIINGNLHLNMKKALLLASINSKSINGKINALLKKNSEAFSIVAKTTYDYKQKKGEVINLEINRNGILRENFSKEEFFVNINSTQIPKYNTAFFISLERDIWYLQNNMLVTLFQETWKTHQLFKYLNTKNENVISLQTVLNCRKRNINYEVDLNYEKTLDIFKMHSLLQLNQIQRLEALMEYNTISKSNHTFDLLFYYPRYSWNLKGSLIKTTANRYNIFIESFCEDKTELYEIFTVTGEYTNSTIELFQNHTILGSLQVYKNFGYTNKPWVIYLNTQCSPELFFTTAQIKTDSNLVLSYISWSESNAYFMLQHNEKEVINVQGAINLEEISLRLNLNIYQHFELFTKVTKPYKKFKFLLYWDKNRDTNKKIDLDIVSHLKKGLYELQFQYPYQKIAAALILLPEEVTINVTLGINPLHRLFLKIGNKVYNIGGIWFAKLETPFPYFENQEFKLSYYILPQNAELKVDLFWYQQKINLIMSGTKSPSHLSTYLDINTTIPETHKINAEVNHLRAVKNNATKITNDILFVFNEHQIKSQSTIEFKNTDVSAKFDITSPSNSIDAISSSMFAQNNKKIKYFSGFVCWKNKNTSLDYKFENMSYYLKLETPIKGLEKTEIQCALEASLEKFFLKFKFNVFRNLNSGLILWNVEDTKNQLIVEIISPIIGTLTLNYIQDSSFKSFKKYLIIIHDNNQVFFEGNLQASFLTIDTLNINIGLEVLEHKASIAVKNNPEPFNSIIDIDWNLNHISSILTANFLTNKVSDFQWNITTNFLKDDALNCNFFNKDRLEISIIIVQKIKIYTNFITKNNYKDINLKAIYELPDQIYSLDYEQNLLLKGHTKLLLKINEDILKFSLIYEIDDNNKMLKKSIAELITPYDFLELNLTSLQTQENLWKFLFNLQNHKRNVLNLETFITNDYLKSDLYISCYCGKSPIVVHSKYDLTNIKKHINITITHESFVLLNNLEFSFENSRGFYAFNSKHKQLTKTDILVESNLNYNREDASFNLFISPLIKKIQIEASSTFNKNSANLDLLLNSEISKWEQIIVSFSLGKLYYKETKLIFAKNNKNITTVFDVNNFNENGNIFSKIKFESTSNFESIKNLTAKISYNFNDTASDMRLIGNLGKHKILLKGRYKYKKNVNEKHNVRALDADLTMDYSHIIKNKIKSIRGFNATFGSLMDITNFGGKLTSLIKTTNKRLKIIDFQGNYKLDENYQEINVDLNHNDDHFVILQKFEVLPKKLVFFVDLQTPLLFHGNFSTKLVSSRLNNSIETELLLLRNSKLHNISLITQYESLSTYSDTIINIVTPDNEYKGGIKYNKSSTKVSLAIYAVIDNNINQIGFSFDSDRYTKSDIYLYVDLVTLNVYPKTVNINYDFSKIKKTIDIKLNDDHKSGLSFIFDKYQLLIKISTPTSNKFLTVSGKHNLNPKDLSISYDAQFAGGKVEINLISKKFKVTTLEVNTSFKMLTKLVFKNSENSLETSTTVDNSTISLFVHKESLFKNDTLLSMTYDDMPFVVIWSGIEKSYITSKLPWGNYDCTLNYASNPQNYEFTVINNNDKLINIALTDITLDEYFNFKASIHNALLSKYSNLTIFLGINYLNINKLNFWIQDENERIVSLSYNLQISPKQYLADLQFTSKFKNIERVLILFNLDSNYLNFKLNKTQFNVDKMYELIASLPHNSEENKFKISFPWDNNFNLFYFFMNKTFINFDMETPLQDLRKLSLSSKFEKLTSTANGFLKFQKNNIETFSNWTYGYHNQKAFASVILKNFLSKYNAEVNLQNNSLELQLGKNQIGKIISEIVFKNNQLLLKSNLLHEPRVWQNNTLFIINNQTMLIIKGIINYPTETAINCNVYIEKNLEKISINLGNIFKLDLDYSNPELHLNIFNNNLSAIFRNSQFDFKINSDINNLEDLHLILQSSSKNNVKTINYRYIYLNKSVLGGEIKTELNNNNKKYSVMLQTNYYEKEICSFSGEIKTGNILKAFYELNIDNEKSHMYFELNTLDPYIMSLIISNKLLPCGGFKIETGISLESKSIFIFGGSGPSTFLEKNIINLESYDKYIFFEIRQENRGIFIKYEAPNFISLQLVDLQLNFHFSQNHLYFINYLDIKSEAIGNLLLNLRLSAQSQGVETKLQTSIPFIESFKNLNLEIKVPFEFSNNFNPKVLIQLPDINYLIFLLYVRRNNEFHLSGGYQNNLQNITATLHLMNTKLILPTIFLEINLPFFQNYNYYKFSLSQHKDLNDCYTFVSDLNAFSKFLQLNNSLIFNKNKKMLATNLTTNIGQFDKFWLNLEYQKYPTRIIKALIFHPNLQKECGFAFESNYHSLKSAKFDLIILFPLQTQIFRDTKMFLFQNLDIHRSKLESFLNFGNFSSSLNLEATLNSTVINFDLNAKIAKKELITKFKYARNTSEDIDLFFELQIPFENIQHIILQTSLSTNFEKDSNLKFKHNSKTLLVFNYHFKKNNHLFKFYNLWKPLLIEYKYFNLNKFESLGKFCWDLNNSNSSTIGGHLNLGKNFSMGLILPSRIIKMDFDQFLNDERIYYKGELSWSKDREIKSVILYKNTTTKHKTYTKYYAQIIHPLRTFQVSKEIDFDMQAYEKNTSYFVSWGKNMSHIFFKKQSTLEKINIVLFVPALKNEIALLLCHRLASSNPTSYFKLQLDYSTDLTKRLEFEFYNAIYLETYETHKRISIKHLASKIDFALYLNASKTPKFTAGSIELRYKNFLLNQLENIESYFRIGHEKWEILSELKTNKNYLHISGFTKSGSYYEGFTVEIRVNEKDPLVVEGIYNFKPSSSSLSLTTNYGIDKKFYVYAGMPSKREITAKIAHDIYDKEITDSLFTLKLNNSQLLSLTIFWRNHHLAQFKNIVLQEYDDVKYIAERMGYDLIEIVEDDAGEQCVNDINDLYKNFAKFKNEELDSLKQDYKMYKEEITEAYSKDAFFCKTLQGILYTHFPRLAELNKKFQQLYMEIYTNLSVTLNNTQEQLENISSRVFNKSAALIKKITNIKNFKLGAKDLLKNGIANIRQLLQGFDELILETINNINLFTNHVQKQCEDFFEPYYKMLDDFFVYIEHRLAILQMIVLDTLDNIQRYIINLREIRELLNIYAVYINWLEQLRVSDILQPIITVIEVIFNNVMNDIKKITDDYKSYIDAISETFLSNYKDVDIFPTVIEFKEKINKAYQRMLWVWNYYNLSDVLKNYCHKFISYLDDYLSSILKIDAQNGRDFENVIGQTDYKIQPDVGLIEITQALPIEWEAFDEMPYLEQNPIYNKIKRKIENLIQLHRYYFSDIINTIKSYIKKSPEALLSPATNNIGMVVGKMHYLTFDKKYYLFSGECNYLLASDFITKTFSVIINYHMENGTINKKSIEILSDDYSLKIYTNSSVAFNTKEVNLPIITNVLVFRENQNIIVENLKGLRIVCNFYYDYCTIELSGWLFGKTGGLLGTMDNEKTTDMRLPDGDSASDVLEFAKSWEAESDNCHTSNITDNSTQTQLSPLSITLFETLCQVFFTNANSPLGTCFGSVDPKPFYEMCVNNMKDISNPSMCSTVAAYKAQCGQLNIQIDIPEICLHCKNDITTNEKIFDGHNPTSMDIVIIKDNSCPNHLTALPNEIQLALKNKRFSTNKYAIIGYDNNLPKPFVYTSFNNIWNSAKETPINTKLHSVKTKDKNMAIEAIKLASNLEFRPGVSKLFILVQCEDNNTEFENINNFYTMFGERDIVLHILKLDSSNSNHELFRVDNKGNILHTNFAKDDFNYNNPTTSVIKGTSDHITDMYTLLALSSNGSVFNAESKMIKNKYGLKFWSDVISQTAKPSPCQRCKCVADADGNGKIECTRCMSPIVKQLLNEYESNIMEFHNDLDSRELL